MIEFLNPAALWRFTGLLLPLGIHLLSRKEGKVIRFGSLRHLTESNTTHFRNIRLNEIALLILRCLLLASIVLYVAGIQVHIDGVNTRDRWLVVEAGIEQQPGLNLLKDSLQHNGYEIH